MKATLARLKGLKFLGKTRVKWAEDRVAMYVETIEKENPELARRLDKTPFAKFKLVAEPFAHLEKSLRLCQ